MLGHAAIWSAFGTKAEAGGDDNTPPDRAFEKIGEGSDPAQTFPVPSDIAGGLIRTLLVFTIQADMFWLMDDKIAKE